MYPTALYPKTAQVLNKLSKLDLLDIFYLAGGTSLALQLGHRKSIDLDFFCQNSVNIKVILDELSNFNPTIIQETSGTLDLLIEDVKISFLEYNYPLLESFVIFENIRLASIIDIACMKLTAVSSRGSRKDFIDLYFILKSISLTEIFNKFEEKYINIKYSKTHILKSLSYFLDAESDPDVDYLTPVSWDDVKESLTVKTLEYMHNVDK